MIEYMSIRGEKADEAAKDTIFIGTVQIKRCYLEKLFRQSSRSINTAYSTEKWVVLLKREASESPITVVIYDWDPDPLFPKPEEENYHWYVSAKTLEAFDLLLQVLEEKVPFESLNAKIKKKWSEQQRDRKAEQKLWAFISELLHPKEGEFLGYRE